MTTLSTSASAIQLFEPQGGKNENGDLYWEVCYTPQLCMGHIFKKDGTIVDYKKTGADVIITKVRRVEDNGISFAYQNSLPNPKNRKLRRIAPKYPCRLRHLNMK